MTARLTVLCLLLLLASVASAQARYVSDQFEVTMRTGTTTQHAIIRMLPSGARLELLQTDAASGYSRVRAADGTEGWVLTRYLMDQPAARQRLESAQQRLESLNARVGELTAEIEVLRGERGLLETERSGLETEMADLRQELDHIRRVSASAVEIDRANRDLRTRLAAAEQSGDALRAEIAELRRNTQRDWFLAGAGVLVAGLVLGLVLPRLKWRRRSRWGEL